MLLALFLIYAPLQMVVDILATSGHRNAPMEWALRLALCSLLLQPVSAIGLWRERRWGVVGLVISLVPFAVPPFCVGGAFWPLVILGATGLRFMQIRKERRKVDSDHEAANPSANA